MSATQERHDAAARERRRAFIYSRVREGMRKLAFTLYRLPKPGGAEGFDEILHPNSDFDFSQELPECLRAEDDLNAAMSGFIEGRGFDERAVSDAFAAFKEAHRRQMSADDAAWLAQSREALALPPAASAEPPASPQEPPARQSGSPARKPRVEGKRTRKRKPEGASLFGDQS